ncbi:MULTISPECIES: DUF2145 domain-containing protein [Asticcacaulis]|uniref:DUF2145 domain-containing protein n=1 Tax=Asticcacaulis TaxID=76890 RepID=UPI001AE52D2D|nr:MULTISPECIES: DUF2145 domain-containing protein [Asticcacaulis]MBP2157505.1 hypothetical protein [Asticcacaulis solisilvae]MDR6798550.1 hypothetical protein [Asticcacaulis sp. BE141]
MRAFLLAAAVLASQPALAQVANNWDAPRDSEAQPVADSGGKTKDWRPAALNAAFAKQIERDLASRQARLAIVFRSGRPRAKLPEGIRYTHGAFWVYSEVKGADGKAYKGYAVHNLYQGDGKSLPITRSYLKQDFPIDFISGAAEDDVAIIIPTPEMQRRLMATIASPTYETMHVADYSLVSSPFDPSRQNCTEFVLDVIAASAWQTTSYAQVKANLKAHFQATPVRTGLFTRVFGPMVDPRLNLDDQKGEIETATYESISAFMTKNRLSETSYVLTRSDWHGKK